MFKKFYNYKKKPESHIIEMSIEDWESAQNELLLLLWSRIYRLEIKKQIHTKSIHITDLESAIFLISETMSDLTEYNNRVYKNGILILELNELENYLVEYIQRLGYKVLEIENYNILLQ